LTDFLEVCIVDHHLDDLTEVGRSIEVDTHYAVLVGFNDAIEAVTFRAKDVTIHSETVGSTVVYGGDLGPKTKNRD
jgi:hypothetical protein